MMRLTNQDLRLFYSLSQTDTGKSLIDYLIRLNAWLCDIRNLKGVSEAERQGRLIFAEAIENHFIREIRISNEKKEDREKKIFRQYE